MAFHHPSRRAALSASSSSPTSTTETKPATTPTARCGGTSYGLSSLEGRLRLLWCACLLLSVLLLSCGEAEGKHAWERPGCHKVGHTRKVTIPECVEFTITTNACRGYCESFAVPSAWYRLQNNPSQAITSVGQCCNIMETEDVTVNVMCVDGQRELVFKSAKSCACYHCKKD